MKRTLIILAAALIGGLAGAVIGLVLDDGGGKASTSPSEVAQAAPAQSVSSPTPSGAGETPEQIYRNASSGVVVITAVRTREIPATVFSPAQKQQVGALGSGFVVDKRGDILTNDHVVQGATRIRVGFSSGASYPATILGADPSTDVALVRVKVPPAALHPLAFDNSAKAVVGDPVYAIGNPFGLDRTMTAGIVSAVGRDIRAPNGLTIPDAIQTDAPINHGNSGGPMLDRFGRVLGVNAQIEGGSVDGNVGVGFAIPSDTAQAVLRQLIASGHAEHAWLGIETETIDPNVAAIVSGVPRDGVVVARMVKGSPAAKAGLKAATRQVTRDGVTVLLGGDTIVGADGTPVDSSTELAAIVARHKPGETIPLQVVRGKANRTVTVRLGNVPGQP